MALVCIAYGGVHNCSCLDMKAGNGRSRLAKFMGVASQTSVRVSGKRRWILVAAHHVHSMSWSFLLLFFQIIFVSSFSQCLSASLLSQLFKHNLSLDRLFLPQRSSIKNRQRCRKEDHHSSKFLPMHDRDTFEAPQRPVSLTSQTHYSQSHHNHLNRQSRRQGSHRSRHLLVQMYLQIRLRHSLAWQHPHWDLLSINLWSCIISASSCLRLSVLLRRMQV